jgi:hypothetical protein
MVALAGRLENGWSRPTAKAGVQPGARRRLACPAATFPTRDRYWGVAGPHGASHSKAACPARPAAVHPLQPLQPPPSRPAMAGYARTWRQPGEK